MGGGVLRVNTVFLFWHSNTRRGSILPWAISVNKRHRSTPAKPMHGMGLCKQVVHMLSASKIYYIFKARQYGEINYCYFLSQLAKFLAQY